LPRRHLASSSEGRDPVDAAIRSMAETGSRPTNELQLLRFIPFDPAVKMAEAIAIDSRGEEIRTVKGAPAAIAALAPLTEEVRAELEALTAAGYRTLAVARDPRASWSSLG
jgi:H+-transporting ATPase